MATIYAELNQYHVIMEVAPRYTQSAERPERRVRARRRASRRAPPPPSPVAANAASGPLAANPGSRDSSTGSALSNTVTPMVPLSAVARFAERFDADVDQPPGRRAGDHRSRSTWPTGKTLADATAAIKQAEADIAHADDGARQFPGHRPRRRSSRRGSSRLLIIAAIVVIYIVLGILYESLIHPITVLSTLPSAGVGAVLALLLFRMDFSIIALIGVFLLIGIVKKNAILIIDFALEAERSRGLSAVDAVREACLLRFRPILMTTLAAALGALPLAIGFGEGAELRRPLGVAIIGGLIASQVLTLLTTPVVYVLLDRLRMRRWSRAAPSARLATETSA